MINKVAKNDIAIELHVPDFQITKDFYSKLGFNVVWEYPPINEGGYMVMKRENSILGFYCGNENVYNHTYFKKFPKNTIRGYAVELVIFVQNESIEDYYNEINKFIDNKLIVETLTTKPWGKKDFRIVDPFGFYIRFTEPDNILVP